MLLFTVFLLFYVALLWSRCWATCRFALGAPMSYTDLRPATPDPPRSYAVKQAKKPGVKNLKNLKTLKNLKILRRQQKLSGKKPTLFLLDVVRGARLLDYQEDADGVPITRVIRPNMAERIEVAKRLAPYLYPVRGTPHITATRRPGRR